MVDSRLGHARLVARTQRIPPRSGWNVDTATSCARAVRPTWSGPSPDAPESGIKNLVVDPGDQIFALQDADAVRGADEPHVEAGVAREEHLVAGLDRGHVGADRGDDAGAHLQRLVRRHDQAARELGLVERLDHEVVVERLERRVVGDRMPFEHGIRILASCAWPATTSRSRTPTGSYSRSAA